MPRAPCQGGACAACRRTSIPKLSRMRTPCIHRTSAGSSCVSVRKMIGIMIRLCSLTWLGVGVGSRGAGTGTGTGTGWGLG